jgi:hypothetical protein
MSYEHMETEWVYCRTMLHAWDEIPYDGEAPFRWRNASRGTTIIEVRCVRCGTLRYDVWSNVTGDLLERTYHTPEGYSLPRAEGRKVLMRKEYLRRRKQSANGRVARRKVA